MNWRRAGVGMKCQRLSFGELVGSLQNDRPGEGGGLLD